MYTIFQYVRMAGTAVVIAVAGCTGTPHPAALTFAVWGDAPYSARERDMALDMLAEQAARSLAFSLHVGDLKDGSAPCDDAVYADRRALLEQSAHPLVLLAGDNDWMDCSRPTAGSHDPFERLAHLRRILFEDGRLDRALRPSVQPGVPEHRRWQAQGIVFVTLNVPGGPMPEDGRSQALRTAVLGWLEAAFDEAERSAAPAMVIAFHGSPDFVSGQDGKRYGWLLQHIAVRAAASPRPLLLIHGDSHLHRTDHPLRHPADGRVMPHVTRLESHGSPWLGWSEVSVSPERDPPFHILSHPGRRD